MGYWKGNQDGTLRTPDYKFTVDSLDDPDLLELRRVVRAHNVKIRKECRRNKWGRGEYHANQLMRVRIMPRGPRAEHAENMFNHWGTQLSRRGYDSYLPLQFGKTFDVYVGQDSHARYVMQRELQTGLTPGMQAKIAKLQEQIWKIEIQGRDNLHG